MRTTDCVNLKYLPIYEIEKIAKCMFEGKQYFKHMLLAGSTLGL